MLPKDTSTAVWATEPFVYVCLRVTGNLDVMPCVTIVAVFAVFHTLVATAANGTVWNEMLLTV